MRIVRFIYNAESMALVGRQRNDSTAGLSVWQTDSPINTAGSDELKNSSVGAYCMQRRRRRRGDVVFLIEWTWTKMHCDLRPASTGAVVGADCKMTIISLQALIVASPRLCRPPWLEVCPSTLNETDTHLSIAAEHFWQRKKICHTGWSTKSKTLTFIRS